MNKRKTRKDMGKSRKSYRRRKSSKKRSSKKKSSRRRKTRKDKGRPRKKAKGSRKYFNQARRALEKKFAGQ